jgi:hypothetical protein
MGKNGGDRPAPTAPKAGARMERGLGRVED